MDDLEIVGNQRDKIRDIVKSCLSEMQQVQVDQNDQRKRLNELSESGNQQEAMKLQIELQQRQMDYVQQHVNQVKELLMPHQLKRMSQISRQQAVKAQSQYAGSPGLPIALANELDLS